MSYATYRPEIVDCSALSPRGAFRPQRHRTTEIVIHKYGPRGYPRTLEGIADAYKREPWSVAAVTLSGGWKDKRPFIDQWKRNGIPARQAARSFVPYHLAIEPSGRVGQFMPLGAKGSHAGKANGRSIAIACLGDFDHEEPADAALDSLGKLLRWLLADPRVAAETNTDQGIPAVTWHDAVRDKPHGCPGDRMLGVLPHVIEWAEGAAELLRQGLSGRI